MAAAGGTGSCVGLLELASIAAGHQTLDGLLKMAAVELLQAGPVSPGKFLMLFCGEVDEVTSALRRGVELAGEALVDRLFIPNFEPTLLALSRGRGQPPEALDALGTIETLSVASTLLAGDVAAKSASIEMVSVGLARGLGGKSWVSFTGEVGDVGVALEAGAARATAAGLLVGRVLIPRPHEGLGSVVGRGIPLA